MTGINLNINNNFGHNWCKAATTDPLVTVNPNPSGNKNLPATIRIPVGFTGGTATNGFDQNASVWTPDEAFVDQFWRFYRVNDTSATAAIHWRFDPAGLDWGAPKHSSTATWICEQGLLLRGVEINPSDPTLDIPHALNVALDAWMMLSKLYIPPASGTDASASQADHNLGDIPYGALFVLPPEGLGGPDIDALFPSGPYVNQQRRLARCIRNYGIYVTDGSSSATMRCDQFVNTAMKTSLITVTSVLKPFMRMVVNNNMAELVAGGGNALAPNVAWDA